MAPKAVRSDADEGGGLLGQPLHPLDLEGGNIMISIPDGNLTGSEREQLQAVLDGRQEVFSGTLVANGRRLTLLLRLEGAEGQALTSPSEDGREPAPVARPVVAVVTGAATNEPDSVDAPEGWSQ